MEGCGHGGRGASPAEVPVATPEDDSRDLSDSYPLSFSALLCDGAEGLLEIVSLPHKGR